MASIRSSPARLSDPRTGTARKHGLPDLLTIALVAPVRGAGSRVDLADLARDRAALFRELLEPPGGAPGHDTFPRLFRPPDPVASETHFRDFLDDLGGDGARVSAIDGRTSRRSPDRAAGRPASHVATAPAARVTVGRVTARGGGNEITAARRLPGLFDPTGVRVTGDAPRCQGETARLIGERGGRWLFTPEANRPVQHAGVATRLADPTNRPRGELTVTGADNGGRIEVRRHVVSHGIDRMPSDRRHPDKAPMPGPP